MHEQHGRALTADHTIYSGSGSFDLERFEIFREQIRWCRGILLCLRFAQAYHGGSGHQGRGGKELAPPDTGGRGSAWGLWLF
jgi:hypothetical protein